MQHFSVKSEFDCVGSILTGPRCSTSESEVSPAEVALPDFLSDLVSLHCAEGYEVVYHMVCYFFARHLLCSFLALMVLLLLLFVITFCCVVVVVFSYCCVLLFKKYEWKIPSLFSPFSGTYA